MLSKLPHYKRIRELRDNLVSLIEETHKEDIATTIASSKYGFVSGALRETLKESEKEESKTTAMIDSVVTSRIFGFPIFIFLMWFMFWATFEVGQYPMDWIDALVGWIGDMIGTYLPDGPVKDLLVDGVIGGVGGVIVFLPYISVIYGMLAGYLSLWYCLVFLTLPMAVSLYYMMQQYVTDPDRVFETKPWMGPLNGWEWIREAGIEWFMIRWLTARNLLAFFCLIIIVICIFRALLA